MKIGIVQFSQRWEKPEENIETIERLVKESGAEYDLLIFPEMTLTGFTMHSEQFAEEIDGIATTFFIGLAARLKKHVFAGIIEKDGDKIFNSLVHFNEKGVIAARYRKIHPYTRAKEDKCYAAGEEMVITKIGDVKIGLTICYDLRFPELYRKICKSGIDMFINIANWPVPRIEHWKTLLKARAIENQCFVAGCNRTGSDPKNEYNGCSAVYDPMGDELLLTDEAEGIFVADADTSRVNEVRSTLPFLNDMKMI